MLQRVGGTAGRRQRQTWLARFSFLGSFQVQTCLAITEQGFKNMIKTRNLGTILCCVMTTKSIAHHLMSQKSKKRKNASAMGKSI